MANALISPQALITKFQQALNDSFGYIYGEVHKMWTTADQKSLKAKYEKDPAKNSKYKLSAEYGGQWVGHWVTDCSGLFTWAFKELGGYMYHGSNTMYRDYCTAKGELHNGLRSDGQELKPGTAVFTGTESDHGHVGLYIGGGIVIEAQGAKAGVITSKVTIVKWTFWGELKGVDYQGGEDVPDVKPETGTAIVNDKKVALREGPSTNCKVLARANKGDKVKLTNLPADWEYVTYNGKSGFMMKKFLDE